MVDIINYGSERALICSRHRVEVMEDGYIKGLIGRMSLEG